MTAYMSRKAYLGGFYEAVAMAVAEFRQGEIITDAPGPMTEFCVTVIRKPIEHFGAWQE